MKNKIKNEKENKCTSSQLSGRLSSGRAEHKVGVERSVIACGQSVIEHGSVW